MYWPVAKYDIFDPLLVSLNPEKRWNLLIDKIEYFLVKNALKSV